MARPHLPTLRRPVLGRSRRARWRRWALRRGAASLCAVAAVVLLVGVVRPPPPETTAVVVASRPLAAGAVLEPADLRVVDVASDPGPVSTVSDPTLLTGRRLTSRIDSGEPVGATRLVPRSPVDGAPAGTVAAHLLVADEASLDLVSAGRRVDLFPDVGGPVMARDVLVLGVDTPGRATLTGSLPGSHDASRGLVLALAPTAVDRIFAGQRPDGGAPRVIAVVTG